MLALVRARPHRRAGATLFQVAVGIAIVGSLLAAFVPRFLRELQLSKVSEASDQLGRMHRAAAAYFAANHGTETTPLERCLPPAAGPTPEEPSEDPVDVPFADPSTPDADRWRSLGFVPDRPIRYRYAFDPVASGCGLRSPEGTYLVTFRAEGDLDGDGERSLFERRARGTEDGELIPIGILYVRDRVE
jgi:type II secretory pathway pseudopilin PulG